MPAFFGQVIPVTGLTYGYPGGFSRTGPRVITARQVLPTTTNPIAFGAPVVNVSSGTNIDCYQSVADFVAAIPGGGPAFTASLLAGIAGREVTTTLAGSPGYPYNPGTLITGSYIQGSMAEAMEMGSMTVYFQPAATGTQALNNPVYIRVAANNTYSSAVVGGWELFADAAVNTTATSTSGSAVITVTSATGIVVGQLITGLSNAVPAGTAVKSISGTSVTMTQNATATVGTAAAVNFASNVLIPGIVSRIPSIDPNTSIGEVTILNRIYA